VVVQSCFEERRQQCIIGGSAFRIAWSHRKGTAKTNVEKQGQKEMYKSGLVMKDAWEKWTEVVKSMTIRNPANSVNGEETGSKLKR